MSKLDYYPRGKMVLCEERAERKSRILLDKVGEATRKAFAAHYVLKAGPGVDDPTLKPGARILVRGSAFIGLVAPKDPRFLIHEEDILAVVEVLPELEPAENPLVTL